MGEFTIHAFFCRECTKSRTGWIYDPHGFHHKSAPNDRLVIYNYEVTQMQPPPFSKFEADSIHHTTMSCKRLCISRTHAPGKTDQPEFFHLHHVSVDEHHSSHLGGHLVARALHEVPQLRLLPRQHQVLSLLQALLHLGPQHLPPKCRAEHFQHPICLFDTHFQLPICPFNIHFQHPICPFNTHFHHPICPFNTHFQHSICPFNTNFQQPICPFDTHFQHPICSFNTHFQHPISPFNTHFQHPICSFKPTFSNLSVHPPSASYLLI